MATIEQCPYCENYNSCSEKMVFNGQFCERYAGRLNFPNPNDKIHGWLAFFLVILGIGGVLSAFYPLVTFDVSEYDGSYVLALFDVLWGFMALGLAIYSIISFLKRKPNAVFLSKMYFIFALITNAIGLFGADFDTIGLESASSIISRIIFQIIALFYFTFSAQVKNIIPKTYRKVFTRDILILLALIIFPVVIIAVVAGKYVYSELHETQTITSANLDWNEYTDGRIIFTKPTGFSCKKQEEDGNIYFHLESSNSDEIIVMSDYDSDVSFKNFDEYWKSNLSEVDFFDECSFDEILCDRRIINGNIYWIKTVQFYATPVFLHFVMLFNEETEKVCIIFYFQMNDNDKCLYELLRSVRFQ